MKYYNFTDNLRFWALVQRDGGGDIWLDLDYGLLQDKRDLNEWITSSEYDQTQEYAICEITFQDWLSGIYSSDMGYDSEWEVQQLCNFIIKSIAK